jgi:CBS domain containing-hemolysin-like protein
VLICQLTAATLVGVLVERKFGGYGLLVGTAVEVVAFFVLAEVAPKTYAVQHTEAAALRLSPLLWALSRFPPLRFISRILIGVANVILPGKGLKKGPYATEEDIRTMADVAAEEEVIEREERRLIHSIFEFGDTVVREVMVPRPDMVGVEADATVDAALEKAIGAGYSRLPAYGDGPDDILGLVYLKDIIRRTRENGGDGHGTLRELVRPAEFVPEQKRVAELLREMQQKKFHMAVVIDEYGGTAGLVTLEDLLEEIVGEIVDEYDVEAPKVERLPDGGLRVAGGTPIDEVNELLEVELPETDWDTVGGLMFGILGHVPVEGETVDFQGLEFRAERVQRRRILTVRITPKESEPAGSAPT